MDLDDYLGSDATTLASLVVAKEVTASELLALARERSDTVNPGSSTRSWVPLTRVADARAADPSLTGPFAGVPFLVKDLAQEYGRAFPTSGGLPRALAHDVADRATSPGDPSLPRRPGWSSSARRTPRSSGPRA